MYQFLLFSYQKVRLFKFPCLDLVTVHNIIFGMFLNNIIYIFHFVRVIISIILKLQVQWIE
jgi:hypothetical protein